MPGVEGGEAAAVHRARIRVWGSFVLAVVLVAGMAVPLHAQDAQAEGLGRAYWHVFGAYAIAWAVVLGWIVSVARRLARVQERLEG